MKKTSKKIISILMLFSMIFSVFSNMVFASTQISSAYIEDLGDCGHHLQYKKNTGEWSYITTTLAGYWYNGNLHYAYCLDVDKHRSRGRKPLYC